MLLAKCIVNLDININNVSLLWELMEQTLGR